MARKAQRTASYWSAQMGGVLFTSEARNIAAVRVGDGLVKAKALVDKARSLRQFWLSEVCVLSIC